MNKSKRIYGYELIVNLDGCSRQVLSSPAKLQEYVDELCGLIRMKKFGPTILEYFGAKRAFTKGYSLVQLIETSSITGHFSEYWKTAYINVFSCRKFDSRKARIFTKEFFAAAKMSYRTLIR